jgi:hypothetical protein
VIIDRVGFAVTIAILAVAVVVRSLWIGGSADFWFYVGMIGVLLLVARAASMTPAELGLERSHVGAGLLWAGPRCNELRGARRRVDPCLSRRR